VEDGSLLPAGLPAWHGPGHFNRAFNGDDGQHPAAAIDGGGGEANQRQPFFSSFLNHLR
jgi:hypothetical protein